MHNLRHFLALSRGRKGGWALIRQEKEMSVVMRTAVLATVKAWPSVCLCWAALKD